MKKLLLLMLALCVLMCCACAENDVETVINLDNGVTVNGAPITEDPSAKVYLAMVVETHEHVPAERAGLPNSVVTITAGGTYRISGTGDNLQIAVRAGGTDRVRLILDGVHVTCRTAPGIAVFSGYDPRTPGEYGVVIELAEGSVNTVTGSHTCKSPETDIKMDGAVDSLISLGFEGNGALTVEADNEGMECKYGHMTINGGVFHIHAADDPLNVSEDGVGVLTVNDGYVFSAVRNEVGGEGDGIDSNGWIIFNGGTAINLAHPASMDGGIDSDMGSYINGGIIVGAGNMYDEVEKDSGQLFMMLEFAESTDDLLVVTDAEDRPVFAYDFPHNYTYICFSTPDLVEGGTYHVYLGGEIAGTQMDGLYSEIESYSPGRQLQHGEGTANRRMPGFGGQMPEGFDPGAGFGGQMPEGFDPGAGFDGQMPEGFDPGAGFDGQMPEGFDPGRGGRGRERPQNPGGFGRGPMGMQSSADVATTDFILTRESCTFSNLTVAR